MIVAIDHQGGGGYDNDEYNARDGAVDDDVNLTRCLSLSVKVVMVVMSAGGDKAIARHRRATM